MSRLINKKNKKQTIGNSKIWNFPDKYIFGSSSLCVNGNALRHDGMTFLWHMENLWKIKARRVLVNKWLFTTKIWLILDNY